MLHLFQIHVSNALQIDLSTMAMLMNFRQPGKSDMVNESQVVSSAQLCCSKNKKASTIAILSTLITSQYIGPLLSHKIHLTARN